MKTTVNIIPSSTNTVSIQEATNKIVVTDNSESTTVEVTQPITSVVQVLTGAQGKKGDQGEVGPAGPTASFDSGSFVTTASFNSFTSSYLADSSSFNSRIGSLTAATSSYVLNSQTSSMTVLSASFARTASFLPVGNYAITSSWAVSASRALTASFLPPGFYNISVAVANFAPTIPGGTDTQIQFNNSNTLDGSGYLTYDYTNRNLKQGFENSAGANTFHFSEDKINNGQFGVSGDLTGEFLVGNFLYISDKDYSNQFGEIVSRIVDVQLNGSHTNITLEVNLNASDTTGYILANLSLWPGDWTGNQETIPFYSHAQGQSSYALGNHSHAEGEKTTAFGISSHAEGYNTRAIGNYSHAEGNGTQAVGEYSHAEGYNTIASASYQHVQGQWNIASSVESAFIVGNGTDDGNRSNLIHAGGNEVQISGSLRVRDNVTVNTNTFAIDSANNRVGIGKTNPSTALDVNGNTIVTGSFTVVTGSAVELRVTNTGVAIGSALTDIHPITGSARLTGSFQITGSVTGQPISLPTASGTASLNCSLGNFFTLTLSSSFTMLLSASNIQPGQTINLRITQPATSGSLTYSSAVFKFPGGIPYTASAIGSAVDIISFISFDSSTLNGTAIKNLS